MSKSQRTKGASYEREVCAVLTQALGRKVQRHIGQARDGGNDITVGPLVIECKRRAKLGTIYKWLQQAKAAARGVALSCGEDFRPVGMYVPTVIAREDGGESLVIMPLDDFLALGVDLSEDAA